MHGMPARPTTEPCLVLRTRHRFDPDPNKGWNQWSPVEKDVYLAALARAGVICNQQMLPDLHFVSSEKSTLWQADQVLQGRALYYEHQIDSWDECLKKIFFKHLETQRSLATA